VTKFLNSDLAAFLLLASTVDLFALTPVFLGRMNIHTLSFAVAVGWVVFGGTSVVAVVFLCFCMGWHCCKMHSDKRRTNKLLFLFAGCSLWGSAAYYYCVYLPWLLCRHSEQIAASMPQARDHLLRAISGVDCDGIHWRVYRLIKLDHK
jgi:hypothetical protein